MGIGVGMGMGLTDCAKRPQSEITDGYVEFLGW